LVLVAVLVSFTTVSIETAFATTSTSARRMCYVDLKNDRLLGGLASGGGIGRSSRLGCGLLGLGVFNKCKLGQSTGLHV
jgi:hypothetical protein